MQVQMQNLRWPVVSFQRSVAHFRFHIIIIHALKSGLVGNRECRSTIHLQSVSENADGIIICCWSGGTGYAMRLQVEYLNEPTRVFIVSMPRIALCFCFSFSCVSLTFRLWALIYVLKVRNPCGQVNFLLYSCPSPLRSLKGKGV